MARDHQKRGDDEAARYCYELAVSRGIEETQALHEEFVTGADGEIALDADVAAILGISPSALSGDREGRDSLGLDSSTHHFFVGTFNTVDTELHYPEELVLEAAETTGYRPPGTSE